MASEDAALGRLRDLLATIDGKPGQPLIIPTESHLIGLGHRSIAAVRTFAGRDSYLDGVDRLRRRCVAEAAFLFDGAICVWAEHIDDSRFERLIEDLLAGEPGVHRVRQVGATREPDDGRDLLADWTIGADRGGEVVGGEDTALQRRRNVLVQVKVRIRGVGRSDVTNLRDTLEHHDYDGLLIVAYPRHHRPADGSSERHARPRSLVGGLAGWQDRDRELTSPAPRRSPAAMVTSFSWRMPSRCDGRYVGRSDFVQRRSKRTRSPTLTGKAL